MSKKYILKTLKDQMFPILLLLFLIVTNSFTRIEFFNDIISPDKEVISVTIEDSSTTIDEKLSVKINASECEDSVYQKAFEYFSKEEYKKAITLWEASLNSSCSKSITYNNISLAYGKLGKTAHALEFATKAVNSDTLNYKAFLNRGNIFADMQRDKEAIADFKVSYNIYKQYPKSSYNLALIYMKKGDNTSAKKWLYRSLENHNDKEVVLNNIAIILQREDSVKEAVELYTKAIRIKPSYTVARKNLALLYWKNKEFEKSVNLYNDIIKIDGPSVELYILLTKVIIDGGDLAQAERIIVKAMGFFRDNIDLQYEYAKILGLQSKDSEALTVYNKIIEADSKNPRVYYNIAKNLGDIGKVNEAIINYKKAIALDKYHENSLYNLGTTLLKEEKYSQAVTYFQRVIELNPENSRASYNLALTYFKLGEYDKSLGIFEKIKDAENSYECYYNMGLIYLDKNECDRAKNAFDTCLIKEKNSYKALYNIGIIFMKKDKYEDAIAKFNEVVRIEKNHEQSYYNIALCYRALKKYDAAIESVKKAIEIDSTYEKAKRILCKTYLSKGDTVSYKKTVVTLDNSMESLEDKIEYAKIIDDKNLIADLAVKRLSYDSLNISLIVATSQNLREAGKFQAAKKIMDVGVSINPTLIIVNKEMFMVLYALELYTESLPYGEQYVSQKPNALSFRKKYVTALEKSGDYSKMVKGYEQIYKISSKRDDLAELAFATLKARDYKAAERRYTTLIAENSSDSNYHYYRALTQERGELVANMESVWRAFIEKFSNDSRGYLQMGILLSGRAEYDRSDEYLQKSIAIKERSISIYYLAYNSYMVENYKKAKELVESYLEKSPNSNRGTSLLKNIQSKIGE